MAISGMAGAGKWIMIALYAIIFFQLIFSIVAAVAQTVETGDFKPIIYTVGGTLFGADEQIKGDVFELSNTSLHVEKPDVYTDKYFEFLRNDIIKQLMLELLMIYIFFLVFRFLLGSQKDNAFKPVLAGLFAFITLGILQMVYVGLITGSVIIPYQGLFELVRNLGSVFTFDTVNSFGVGLVNSTGNSTM